MISSTPSSPRRRGPMLSMHASVPWVPACAGTTVRLFRRFWLILLAAAAIPAQAHNFHAGITDISYNARTGSTELVHTYMAHDVEGLLTNLYQRQFDLSQPDDQDVLRQYVERQFW